VRKPKKKKSRSKSRSRDRRESFEREVYIERDRFVPVPYPVREEPQYETFRYVDAPRRHAPQRIEYREEPQRRMIEDETRIHITDREREREREREGCHDQYYDSYDHRYRRY